MNVTFTSAYAVPARKPLKTMQFGETGGTATAKDCFDWNRKTSNRSATYGTS